MNDVGDDPEEERPVSRSRWLDVGVGVLVICAVVVTGLLVRRELFPGEGGSDAVEAMEVRRVDDWRSYAEGGHRMGPSDASVLVIEFADFQCRYCRVTARHLEKLRSEHPGDVAVVYRHFPLDNVHPHATTAARASECAAEQDAFEGFHDAVFSVQDSLGEIPWSRLAHRAGVADTVAFGQCLADNRTAGDVREDVAAGSRLGIQGTPSLLVNDQLLQGAPTYEQLESEVEARLGG